MMSSVNLFLVVLGLVIAAINGFAGSWVAARIARAFARVRPVRVVAAVAVVVATVAAIAFTMKGDREVTCHPHVDASSHTTTC